MAHKFEVKMIAFVKIKKNKKKQNKKNAYGFKRGIISSLSSFILLPFHQLLTL